MMLPFHIPFILLAAVQLQNLTGSKEADPSLCLSNLCCIGTCLAYFDVGLARAPSPHTLNIHSTI